MDKKEEARNYLRMICVGFIDEPDNLSFVEKVDERGLVFTVKAAAVDMKRLIGRKGTVANSLRRIMDLWGRKNNAKVSLVIY